LASASKQYVKALNTGGEGGDAAFARQVIAEESDLPDLGGRVHELTAWPAFTEKQTL
jgi:hypothetical protein